MIYQVANILLTKTSMLRSDLCGYSDAHIVVKGRIPVEGDNDDKRINKKVIFKNNAPFRSCISKINNMFVDNAEDLDIVMLMHNLLEYSDNYSMTSGRLCHFYKDETNDDKHENDNAYNNNTITSNSFAYKTKIIGRTPDDNNTLDTEVLAPLKYLSDGDFSICH